MELDPSLQAFYKGGYMYNTKAAMSAIRYRDFAVNAYHVDVTSNSLTPEVHHRSIVH